MRLSHDGDKFILSATTFTPSWFEAAATRAGFFFDPGEEQWTTKSIKVAARLRAFADVTAENKIERAYIRYTPWSGRIPYPKGQKPKPFQPPAAKFILERNRSYLAGDPGVGKTIIMALALNALGRHPVVITCPPFLVLNTIEELKKWVVWKPRIETYGDPYLMAPNHLVDILIVPDSFFGLRTRRNHVVRYIELMGALGDASLFIDEAHRFKNESAGRTKTLNRIERHFDRICLMSGSPIENRPIELYNTLSRFAPETIDFMTEKQYGMKYCEGFQEWNEFRGIYVYDFSGSSGFEKLANRIRGKFMLRIKKRDVLKELPPKTTKLVFLGEKVPPKVRKLDRSMLREHAGADTLQEKWDDPHTSTYRRLIGEAKASKAVEFIEDLLSDTDESVLVFAEHISVVEKLKLGLRKFNPVVITGATPKAKRHELVKLFQTDKTRRVFLGNTKACGVGFTLTKATRTIHVEPSWVPTVSDQATDRAHRIGQTENVYEYLLVFKNSMDRAVIESNLKKRKTIDLL